ncbi:MAG: methionine adenosyltransferase, partial [Victivallales bacterium]|nr:methionine adenosyltransferase [Victivallales bacterium]
MYIRNEQFIFASEAVSEGHPDKVCDQISDAVLDAALKNDPEAHVACETLATTDLVVLSGEIKPVIAGFDYESLVRGVVQRIGYDRPEEGFDYRTLQVLLKLHEQSADIDMGVDAGTSLSGEQGAGDQ